MLIEEPSTRGEPAMDIGAQLRASREARGVSLERIAQATRVQPRILAAIERNDIAAIPPRPSGRSFVRSYASEVGLNPDLTVHDYFAQFAPVVTADETTASLAPSPPRPRSLLWTGGAVLLVLLTAGAALRVLTSGSKPPQTGIIGTSGQSAAPSPTNTPARSEAPDDRTRAAATPPTQDLTVVMTASAPCWVTATADGKRVIYRLLPTGAQETLRATREITILAGDAAALSIDVNGRRSGVLGSSGEVRTIRLTPGELVGR
jgi:cytoskeleton protein RodZ